jgi:hypothetical protein
VPPSICIVDCARKGIFDQTFKLSKNLSNFTLLNTEINPIVPSILISKHYIISISIMRYNGTWPPYVTVNQFQ